MEQKLVTWLAESGEPWTRYRTLVDLAGRPESDAAVMSARRDMVDSSAVKELVARAATWGQTPLKRHNDAGHAIYALSTLAHFGLRIDDPGLADIAEMVATRQSAEGAFRSVANISPNYGGTGEDQWTWMACDAPTLLYALVAFGLEEDPRVHAATEHLIASAESEGYRCTVSDDLGTFRGPGKRGDPCPIANVYALRALSLSPAGQRSDAARQAGEMLLRHWQEGRGRKYYLFGVGTDFRKLKYPFVWYDILHVAEVLSRFEFSRADPRFRSMLEEITSQADSEGRYTAGSMYRAWKGWSFADKKAPSPWLTYVVKTIEGRVRGLHGGGAY